MFVRGETQGGDVGNKVVNPDEIDIGFSDDDYDREDGAEEDESIKFKNN